MPNLEIISAHPSGALRARLRITQSNVNRLSIVHGGLISSLVDTCGSLSISARGLWISGVSTDIHVSYLRSGGLVGNEIEIEAKVDSIGRTLAYTSVVLRHPDTDKVFAKGTHTKFVANSLEDARNVTFDATGDHIIQGTMPADSS